MKFIIVGFTGMLILIEMTLLNILYALMPRLVTVPRMSIAIIFAGLATTSIAYGILKNNEL